MSDAFIVRRGGSSAPKQFYLVKDGNYAEGITGFNLYANVGAKGSKITQAAGRLEAYTGPWGNGQSATNFVSLQAVDLTKYKRLRFDVRYENAIMRSVSWCGVSDAERFNWDSSDYLASTNMQNDTSRRTYVVDISKITGLHKIAFTVFATDSLGSNTLNIFNIWLEK